MTKSKQKKLKLPQKEENSMEIPAEINNILKLADIFGDEVKTKMDCNTFKGYADYICNRIQQIASNDSKTLFDRQNITIFFMQILLKPNELKEFSSILDGLFNGQTETGSNTATIKETEDSRSYYV